MLDETQPDLGDMDVPLEMSDEPLTDGRLPFDEMILTADEQRQLFEEAGIPLNGVDVVHCRNKKKH